jgi:hypothetical protein
LEGKTPAENAGLDVKGWKNLHASPYRGSIVQVLSRVNGAIYLILRMN